MPPEMDMDLQSLSRKLAKFDDSIQGVAIIDNQGVVLAQFPRNYKIDEDIKRDFGSIVATVLGISRHAGRFAGEARLTMNLYRQS